MSISGMFILFILLVSDNGRLLTANENVEITACDGSLKYGTVVRVKYSEMKIHCMCQIKPHFVGFIRFASNMINSTCNTEIDIFDVKRPYEVLRLPCGPRKFGGLSVTNESLLYMTSIYVNSTNGIFQQEITIFEDTSFNGNISVICGTSISTLNPNTKIKVIIDTFSKITVSSQKLTKDVQTENRTSSPSPTCSSTNSIISGFSGAAVGVLLTVIISIVIRHMRKTKQKTGPNDDTNAGQPNNDTYEGPLDNPPYQSYQAVDNDQHIYIPLQN
ncbi:uncharacterized protein LOC134250542 isoform X3 [Saccostrea cucullata]|uniref:uncharacterized protein LOC134250542 isoform X3 n=1 Tax=Saccostrea cuccullata TaxID=36930 RepID=UPI002ED1AC00